MIMLFFPLKSDVLGNGQGGIIPSASPRPDGTIRQESREIRRLSFSTAAMAASAAGLRSGHKCCR